jgi:DNA-binding CsgD family transcriptional regulator
MAGGEIVERETELSAVRAFLDRPPAGLRALVLEGEAGIGKSTVWRAALELARQRSFRVLSSRPAEAEQAIPFAVLGDLFTDVEDGLLEALPVPQRRAFEAALLREEPDAPVDPRALGVSILSVLSVLVRGGPLLIAIDDLQWVDASSAAALAFALRRSVQRPITLLVAGRTDDEPAALRAAIQLAEVQHLRVGPLSLGAIQQMFLRSHGSALPRPTLLQVHELSGGNPFFALELVRARAERPPGDASLPIPVPPRLESLVAARFATLDEGTRQSLLLVATHGRTSLALLDELGLRREALEPAIEAAVIEVSGGVVRFTHPLLASVLYRAASLDGRRSAHRLLASVIDDPVLAAPHLALAASGPDPDLAASLESAAGIARERGMAIAAADLGEHALRLTPIDEREDRRRRACQAARTHLEAGDPDRARALVRDALAVSDAGTPRAETLLLGAELEEQVPALALLHDALAEATRSPELRSAIHAQLAANGRLAHGRAWAERHARTSRRLADELDDDRLRSRALSILAELRFERADPGALELAQEAHRLAVGRDAPVEIQLAIWSVGHQLVWMRRSAEARAWLQRWLEDWGDRNELARAEALWYLALAEFWAGRWEIAATRADEASAIRSLYGLEEPPDLLPRSLVALHRGDLARAAELSTRAMSLGPGMMLPAHEAILGTVALWGGRPEEAEPRLARAEELAASRGIREPDMIQGRPEHVEALLQLGRVADAAELVDKWRRQIARGDRAWARAEVVRSEGLVATARSDLEAAAELLEEAVRQHEVAGDPFGRGRALLALGVVRRRERQRRAARSSLQDALETFESLGAATWTAKTREELARIGGRQRIEGLSESERRVAELAAEGRTNREIASVLYLGERTVASHLTHAYAKLGIRSRTELAGQFRREARSASVNERKVPTF